ncbi:MAG: ribonuclease catalytic domain-containing protein [Caldimicrobium sp.]|jgi:exoribonuclease-2
MSLERLLYRIVEVFYKEKIITAYIKEIKGKRLHLFLPTGREELISHTALISVSEEKFQPETLSSLEGLLKEKHEKREKLKEVFNLRELWEVIVDDLIEATSWELVELYLGRKPNSDEVAGFMRRILEDRVYFSFECEDRVKIRSREEVNQLLHQKEKELERIKLLNEGEIFLSGLLQGKRGLIPDELEKYFLEGLREYVLFEEGKERIKVVKELLERHGLSEPLKVVELLIKAKYVEEDWFFELEKMKYPQEFSERELSEAESVQRVPLNFEDRVDLRHLHTFTIDSPETEDYDDALSVEERQEKYLLYVHITDVATFVKPGTALWEGAFERASTLYLPEKVIPMFPFSLSHEKFSLKKDEDRYALTFVFEFTPEGEISSFQIKPSIIKVKERLSYDEVDKFLVEEKPFWKKLYEFLLKQKEKRIKSGAFAVILPEIQVKVYPDGEISVQRLEMTKARDLVSEAMILANYYGALFLKKWDIPALFRSQKEPFQIFEERETSLFYQILQLKFMAKSELTLEPGYHSGLGLSCYTTLTSPIRRALDLLIQFQLKAYLLGEKFLTKDEILRILPDLQTNLQRAQFLQGRRKKYYLLKYLLRYKKNETFNGIVMEVQSKKAKVYLPDYNLTGEVFGFKYSLKPGEVVTVKLEKINPLQELLRLRIV